MKLIDVVYEVLKDSAAPMGADEIERAIRERGLYESKGKTLYAWRGDLYRHKEAGRGVAVREVRQGQIRGRWK